MGRFIWFGMIAFAVGLYLCLAKLDGLVDIPWVVATSPWWVYGGLAATVCVVVAWNLITGR